MPFDFPSEQAFSFAGIPTLGLAFSLPSGFARPTTKANF
jgi:hypothetical protein